MQVLWTKRVRTLGRELAAHAMQWGITTARLGWANCRKPTLPDDCGECDNRCSMTPPSPPSLTLIHGDCQRSPVSGEQVLRDGARLHANFLTQMLDHVPPADPRRHAIEDLADQYRALAG